MSKCGDLSRFSLQREFTSNITTFGHFAKRGAKLAKNLYQAYCGY